MSLSYPDAGVTLFYPDHAVTVDVSAVDFDCGTHFPLGFATQIYVGISAPADVAVLHVGDSTAVTYKNVPQGHYLKGAFAKILHTGTTATGLLALGI